MEYIGGQAVIEGVMMKSKDKLSIAVRNPEGEIEVKTQDHISLTKKYKFLNIPLIRGSIILVETMILGFKALDYSANVAVEDEDESKEGKSKKFNDATMILMFLFSLGIGLLLFKFVPLFLAQTTSKFLPVFENRYLFNITEGLIKIGILVGYIYAISFMDDVKRVFQYHGAEHKTVNAYENNDLENAHKYSKTHIRCGTSFILFVLALSIIVYIFLPTDISIWGKYGLRILFLPLIAGIAYELIKYSPKFEKYFLFKLIVSPGLVLQGLTTLEPDEKQIEVAKAALKASL